MSDGAAILVGAEFDPPLVVPGRKPLSEFPPKTEGLDGSWKGWSMRVNGDRLEIWAPAGTQQTTTAQAELVGDVWSINDMDSQRHPNGWLVRVDPDYDPRQGADFAKPAIGQIIAALNEAHRLKGDPNIRDAALAKAELFRADRVFDEHWRPLLAQMAADLERKPIPMNREQRRARQKVAVAR